MAEQTEEHTTDLAEQIESRGNRAEDSQVYIASQLIWIL